MFRHQPEPMFPEYANVYNRLRSFAGHTLPAGQRAEELADAGFFYVGNYNINYGKKHSVFDHSITKRYLRIFGTVITKTVLIL